LKWYALLFDGMISLLMASLQTEGKGHHSGCSAVKHAHGTNENARASDVLPYPALLMADDMVNSFITLKITAIQVIKSNWCPLYKTLRIH
jgi:hypothetical protein